MTLLILMTDEYSLFGIIIIFDILVLKILKTFFISSNYWCIWYYWLTNVTDLTTNNTVVTAYWSTNINGYLY